MQTLAVRTCVIGFLLILSCFMSFSSFDKDLNSESTKPMVSYISALSAFIVDCGKEKKELKTSLVPYLDQVHYLQVCEKNVIFAVKDSESGLHHLMSLFPSGEFSNYYISEGFKNRIVGFRVLSKKKVLVWTGDINSKNVFSLYCFNPINGDTKIIEENFFNISFYRESTKNNVVCILSDLEGKYHFYLFDLIENEFTLLVDVNNYKKISLITFIPSGGIVAVGRNSEDRYCFLVFDLTNKKMKELEKNYALICSIDSVEDNIIHATVRHKKESKYFIQVACSF